MLTFDLKFYKPTKLELWISQKYQENGICSPKDMDIDVIAEIFNCCVSYTKGNTKVIFDDVDGGLIFLRIDDSKEQQQCSFYHELSHVALHVGDQRKLPKTFIDLQETQATQFQLVAAMPIYLIQQIPIEHLYKNYIFSLSEIFCQPTDFVIRRVNQIIAKIQREIIYSSEKIHKQITYENAVEVI